MYLTISLSYFRTTVHVTDGTKTTGADESCGCRGDKGSAGEADGITQRTAPEAAVGTEG